MKILLYRLTQLLFITLLIVLSIGPAFALDLDVRSSRANILDFSLVIERSTTDFDHSIDTLEANLERFGIVSIDVPSTGLQFGLLLGYAFLDFTNNSVFESIGMDGYYIGTSVRGQLIRQGDLSLWLSGQFIYQSVDGRDEAATSSLSWNEFNASALLKYRVPNAGVVFLGLNAGIIDAHFRYSGVTNTSINLDNKNETGYTAGFSYSINRLEAVSIQYKQSYSKGVSLQFRKLF